MPSDIKGPCTYCGDPGHWRPDCPELRPSQRREATPDDVQAAIDMVESNVFFGDAGSHADAAVDAGRTLAKRVRELEATIVRDWETAEGEIDRLKEQLAAAEALISHAFRMGRKKHTDYSELDREHAEYREKYPKGE